MEYFRDKRLTVAACVFSIIACAAGPVLYENFGMPKAIITICLAAAAIVSVILIVLDFRDYNSKLADAEFQEKSEKEALDSELNKLKERVTRLTEENNRAIANLRESDEITQQLQREQSVNLDRIETYKRQIEELSQISVKAGNKANQADAAKAVKDFQIYRETIGQWSADTIAPIRNLKKFADLSDDKELSKNADIVFGNIEKILYFTNIDKINGKTELTSCVLNNVIKEILKKYTYIFNEKKIGIFRKGLESVVSTNKIWFVYGFSQVLYNALYSTGEFGKIAIISKEDESNVYLTVEDSSMGIRDEELENVFEPGFISSEAKRISGNTTSTCLYLAKKAFEKAGADISAESKYGMGTKITMTFKKPAKTAEK